jgi:hypothetical protein
MDWCMDESGSIALIVMGGVVLISGWCTILCIAVAWLDSIGFIVDVYIKNL